MSCWAPNIATNIIFYIERTKLITPPKRQTLDKYSTTGATEAALLAAGLSQGNT